MANSTTERTANRPTAKPMTAEAMEEMKAARPSISLAISIKGKLGNHQDFPAHTHDIQIGLAVFVFKNPQIYDFFSQSVAYCFVIIPADAGQDQISFSNPADHLIIYGNRCVLHTLYYNFHITPSRKKGRVPGLLSLVFLPETSRNGV